MWSKSETSMFIIDSALTKLWNDRWQTSCKNSHEKPYKTFAFSHTYYRQIARDPSKAIHNQKIRKTATRVNKIDGKTRPMNSQGCKFTPFTWLISDRKSWKRDSWHSHFRDRFRIKRILQNVADLSTGQLSVSSATEKSGGRKAVENSHEKLPFGSFESYFRFDRIRNMLRLWYIYQFWQKNKRARFQT